MSRGVKMAALLERLRQLRTAGTIGRAASDVAVGIAQTCGIAGAEMTVCEVAGASNVSERAAYKALPLLEQLEIIVREPSEGSRSNLYRIHDTFAERKSRRPKT